MRCKAFGALLLMSGVAQAALIGQAAAQEARGSAIAIEEDVIVTARKREESLLEVPMAITSLSQSFLDDANVENLSDALQYAPNVSFDDFQNDSFSGSIAIRGAVRLTDVEEPGYGLYRDGVYIGSAVVGLDEFSDIARLEILKGPQGGLYGRNAIGGAINIITHQPEDSFEASASVSVASYERTELRGMINAPLIDDRLLLRVNAFVIDQDDGLARSATTGDQLDAVRSEGLRVQTALRLENSASVTWTGEWLSADQPAAIILNDSTVPPGNDEDALVYNTEHGVRRDVLHLYQTIEAPLGDGVLTNIISYRTMDVDSRTGFAPFVGPGGALRQSDQENWFVEARYAGSVGARFDYIVGLNYLNETNDFYRILNLPIGVVPDNPPNLPPNLIDLGVLSPITTSTTELESWALFAEGVWSVTDRLEFTLSGRLTNETKRYDFVTETPSALPFIGTGADIGVGAPINFPGFQLSGAPWFLVENIEESWDNFSPQASLSYRPTDNATVYMRVATGFKAGGFNNEASSSEDVPFDPETALTYEVGYHGAWFDNRLLVNFAAFTTKREDTAILVADPAPIFQFLGVSIVDNGGQTITNGAELDFRARPLEGLELYGAVGWLDAEFDGEQLIGGVNVDGNKVPQTADWSYVLAGTYRMPMTEQLDLFLQGSYSTRSGGYELANNVTELQHPEEVRFSLGMESDSWSLIGYVDNALDDRVRRGQRSNGNYTLTPPRRFGVRLERRW